ncbi:hypothetical protein [Amycolatopsis oliviviridis]|uniref:hypothetical protein n=1 Tax=Amycolatopsis oliviviridis TaxID=1471590 RepID=UPI001749C9FA|nr:hypothetical protein [Amycolatopsis oliviviridis]
MPFGTTESPGFGVIVETTFDIRTDTEEEGVRDERIPRGDGAIGGDVEGGVQIGGDDGEVVEGGVSVKVVDESGVLVEGEVAGPEVEGVLRVPGDGKGGDRVGEIRRGVGDSAVEVTGQVIGVFGGVVVGEDVDDVGVGVGEGRIDIGGVGGVDEGDATVAREGDRVDDDTVAREGDRVDDATVASDHRDGVGSGEWLVGADGEDGGGDVAEFGGGAGDVVDAHVADECGGGVGWGEVEEFGVFED